MRKYFFLCEQLFALQTKICPIELNKDKPVVELLFMVHVILPSVQVYAVVTGRNCIQTSKY